MYHMDIFFTHCFLLSEISRSALTPAPRVCLTSLNYPNLNPTQTVATLGHATTRPENAKHTLNRQET